MAPTETVLVAVHPWDCAGARRAGLRCAWLDRQGAGWPEGAWGPAPELVAQSMPELADALLQ